LHRSRYYAGYRIYSFQTYFVLENQHPGYSETTGDFHDRENIDRGLGVWSKEEKETEDRKLEKGAENQLIIVITNLHLPQLLQNSHK